MPEESVVVEGNRVSLARGLRAVAKEADVGDLEVKVLELRFRANGQIVWRATGVDPRRAEGGVCTA